MIRSAALLSASTLLSLSVLNTSPATAESNTGTLTVCLVGLGKHGKVQIGHSETNLETGQGLGIGNSGYYRYSGCHVWSVEEPTRFYQTYAPKAPYRLRSVSSKQTNGNNAKVTVPVRKNGFTAIMDTIDNVTVVLSYVKKQ